MTLHKKNGMWISDWSNKDSDDSQGCEKRQMEQIQKAFDIIGKMEKQGWKVGDHLKFEIGDKGTIIITKPAEASLEDQGVIVITNAEE